MNRVLPKKFEVESYKYKYFGGCSSIDRNSCLDIKDVKYADSSGLSTILVFRKLADIRREEPVLLVEKDGAIEKLIKRTQLDGFFNLVYELNKL